MKTRVSALARWLLAMGLSLWASNASAQIVINEIRTDNPGTDSDEYFELKGPPSASLNGLTYLVIGDSTGTKCGVIECVVPLIGLSLKANGLLCLNSSVSAAAPVLTGYDGSTQLNFENSDNVTHMLVSGFTGVRGQDLDTNDDGVLDVTPWTAIVDCIGLNKGTVPNCDGTSTSEDRLYCGTLIGPDGAFVPSHVYRYSDTNAWSLGLFSPLGTDDTPGAPNFSQFAPPPIYVDMGREPCVPTTGQPVTVTTVIDNHPTSCRLYYTVNGGAVTALDMDVLGQVGSQVTFFAQIPGQASNGAKVEYHCDAWNTNPDPSRSYDQGYFVGTMTVSALRSNDANGSNLYRYYGARVRGHVTAAYGVFGTTNTDYYVQDATGGLNVFKFGPHLVHPLLGDDITVAGAIDQYNGKLELTAVSSCDTVLVTINGSGSAPTPQVIAACDLDESVEGKLVEAQRLLIHTGGDPAFLGNKSYKAINCMRDTVELFIDADTDIPGHTITTNYLEVVGIAGQYDPSTPYTFWYQIQPRSISDIHFLSLTGVTGSDPVSGATLWPCVPNPVVRTAEIRYRIPAGPDGEEAVPVRLAVFDLHGRTIATLVDGPVTPGVHTASLDRALLETSGIYFYRLEVGGTALTRKLVMVRP